MTPSKDNNSNRMADLLVSILVRAAQQDGQISAERRHVMLCFFQGNMRYGPDQLAQVQRQMETARKRGLDLSALVNEFRARLDGNPRLERIAYNSCLLLTEMVYRLIHTGGKPASGELSLARTVAGQLGIFSDDLRRVELRYGIATVSQRSGVGATGAQSRPGTSRQTELELFEWLYISIMVQVGCLDGHFTRGKLRLILEFFQGNMLYSGKRLQHVIQLARQAWLCRNLPECALSALATEFHRAFNYATRRMLLDHAFRLLWSSGQPQKDELRTVRDLASQLRIFSADLKGIEDKYQRRASAKRQERQEQQTRKARAQQDEQARQEGPGARTRQNQERTHHQSTGQGQAGTGQPGSAPAGETAYCAVLGVRPGASLAIIKKAWHAQALKFHPDKMAHLGPEFVALAEQKTKAINAAYSYFAERRKTAP